MAAKDWFKQLSHREQLKLSAFTAHRDGYYRWYRGKSRYVCSKNTAPELVEDLWSERKKEIDADGEIAQKRTRNSLTLHRARLDETTGEGNSEGRILRT